MLAKGPFQRSRNFLKKLEKSHNSFDLWLFSLALEGMLAYVLSLVGDAKDAKNQ
jgi:hypothetical protein